MTRYRHILLAPMLLAAVALPAPAHASGLSSLWYGMMSWAKFESLADGRFTLR